MVQGKVTSITRIGNSFIWIGKTLNGVGFWMASAATVWLVVLVTWNIVGRRFFMKPVSWALEGSQATVPYIILLSAGYVLLNDRHISMDMLVSRLSRRNKLMAVLVVYPVGLAYSLLLAFLGWQMVQWSAEMGSRSESLRVPIAWFHAALPIGGILLSLSFIIRIFEALTSLRKGREGEPGHD